MEGNRKWWPVALLGFISWILLSIIFRSDRLYGDAAFYLFNCINDLKLFTAHERPVTALIQLFPLILARSNAEMITIIHAFSLNESLFTILLACIPLVFLKDFRLGVAMILPLFLGVKWNYYNPVSELILCGPIFIGAFGFLWSFPNSKFSRIGFIPLSIYLVLNHPLYYVLVPAIYILFITEKKLPLKWVFVHCLVLLFVIGYKVATADSYDQQQLLAVKALSFSDVLKLYLSWSSVSTLLVSFGAMFIILIILFYRLARLVSPVTWIYSLLLTSGLFIGVLYKFHFMFPDTYEPFERYLFPVSLLTGIFFYFASDNGNGIRWLISTVIIIQSVFIYNYGISVQLRNDQLLNVIKYAQDHHLTKVVVSHFNFNPTRLGHNWSMIAESLLLSKANGNKHSVQVAIYESFDKNLLLSIGNDQYVHFPWWAISEKELNSEYFYLYRQPFKMANSIDSLEYKDLKAALSIRAGLSKQCYAKLKHSRNVQMKFENSGTEVLHSGINPNLLLIGANWFKEGKEVRFAGEVPLLADILPGSLNQYFNLNTELTKGSYDLQFYLKYKGQIIALLNVQKGIEIN